MAPTSQPQRIINTRPNPATSAAIGDVQYQASDGQWWGKTYGATSAATGMGTATLYRGVIFPNQY